MRKFLQRALVALSVCALLEELGSGLRFAILIGGLGPRIPRVTNPCVNPPHLRGFCIRQVGFLIIKALIEVEWVFAFG